MKAKTPGKEHIPELFELPCACQNLRRLTRMVTRIYDRELRKAGLEITQFGLLTALATAGEGNQKRLRGGFRPDSTPPTPNLPLVVKQSARRDRTRKNKR